MTLSLDAAMRAFEPALPLGVALSGGADSTALLMACATKWPGQVVALHVNHGLQAAATAFESQCVALCAHLQVPLRVQKVEAHAAQGQSPEDAARIARYASFSALARMDNAQAAIQSIAIAQHADDQVETVLLALGRGAGLAGLSAMPERWSRDGLVFHRPLLRVASADIRQWLVGRGTPWVEDPSNADMRFTRNRIRAQLLPALADVFPQVRDTVARSAAHAAQAQGLLDEVADTDLLAVCRSADAAPQLRALQTLSRARQANALRRWLKQTYSVIPSTAQLDELLDQVQVCTTRGHRICIKVGAGMVERQGAVLAWYNGRVLL
jgi:tRNA(Ile)-lysidine synthase